jgi:hypothetical protein
VVAAGIRQARRAGDLAAQRPRQRAARVDVASGDDRGHSRHQDHRDERDQPHLLDARRSPLTPTLPFHVPDARTPHRAGGAPKVKTCLLLSFPFMEGSPFNLFGDPDEFRARMEELSEQMQSSQRVAWADNAIKLAVEMTVASIGRLELTGDSDQQAMQVRDAIRVLFPEAVTLVREAREGLS